MTSREDVYRDALQRIVDPASWIDEGCSICGSVDGVDSEEGSIDHAPDCVITIAAEALSYGQVFPRAPRS